MKVGTARVRLACALLMPLLCMASMAQESADDRLTEIAFVTEQGDPETSDQDAGQTVATAKKGKFMVLPLVVTEPAIGEGAGAGIVYFHGKETSTRPRLMNGKTVTRTARNSTPPPNVTGVMGFYTNNGTHGVGLGHSSSLKDDTYRIAGVIADATVISDIYLLDIPFEFEIEGKIAYGSIKRRVGSSNVFLGLALTALEADVAFNFGPDDQPAIPLLNFGLTNVGAAASATYDRRDNSTMPENGQLVDLSIWRYDDAIGSDFEYTSSRVKLLSFHQLHEKFVLGLRFDVSTVSGDPPFFAVPFVSLRGIPAFRFQGDTAGAFEVDGRYKFADRWVGVAFAGTGFSEDEKPVLESSEDISAYGIGFRFKALKEQNVWIGVDVAQGPEDMAWYFQVGQGW